MADFIENPRRTPRVAVRCRARVALKEGGYWSSRTSDYGPRGCQLVSPSPLTPGSRLFVELSNERVERTVELAGRVAWISREPPWRAGVAFDRGSQPAAEAFFAALAAAYEGIDAYGQAPERIPRDAPLAPTPPPSDLVPALTDEEVRVLAALGPGRPAHDLGGDLGATCALFALLGRRYVGIGAPDPAAAEAWAGILRAGQPD